MPTSIIDILRSDISDQIDLKEFEFAPDESNINQSEFRFSDSENLI